MVIKQVVKSLLRDKNKMPSVREADKDELSRTAIMLMQDCEWEYSDAVNPEKEWVDVATMKSNRLVDSIKALIDKGLDCSHVTMTDYGADHPMWYARYINAPNVGASLMRLFLDNGADPNMPYEGDTFFNEVQADLLHDLEARADEDWTFRVQEWWVLMAFGGRWNGTELTIKMLNDNDVSIFKEFEHYEYSLDRLQPNRASYGNYVMHVFDKRTGEEVARLDGGSEDNVFLNNQFDPRLWDAPMITDPQVALRTLWGMQIKGRTIVSIQAVGLGYNLSGNTIYETIGAAFDRLPIDKQKEINWYELPDEIEYPYGVPIPVLVEIDEPLLIRFSDGDILAISFVDGGLVRMELNSVPWDVKAAYNEKNFDANILFGDVINKKIIRTEVWETDIPPLFAGVPEFHRTQTKFIEEIRFYYEVDGKERYMNFTGELDWGYVSIEDENGFITIPSEKCYEMIYPERKD